MQFKVKVDCDSFAEPIDLVLETEMARFMPEANVWEWTTKNGWKVTIAIDSRRLNERGVVP